MKIGVLIIAFLVFISCKNVTEKQAEQQKIIVDSTGLKFETSEKQIENTNLHSFLENPIDLQKFKKKKNRDVTTSVSNGQGYYFNPKIKDSIFYSYFFPDFRKESIKIDEIIVFKYGENKHTYDDETEILIELRISNADVDLGKANLVGLTKSELESEFGTDYLTWNNGIVYSSKNRIVILELDNSKIKSFRYIKLNTENVDQALIDRIVE